VSPAAPSFKKDRRSAAAEVVKSDLGMRTSSITRIA